MNLSPLLSLFDDLPVWQAFSDSLDGDDLILPLQLPTSARAAVLGKLYLEKKRPFLFITSRADKVAEWQQALETWLPESITVTSLPEPTPLPNDYAPWSDRSRLERIGVLSKLLAGQHPHLPKGDAPPFIISSVRAILQKTMPKRNFITAARQLRVGQLIDLQKTAAHWTAVGYEAVTVVEKLCQYSQRGGILDIFPIGMAFPVRIELFGDEIDTMRLFDPASQRTISPESGAQPTKISIPPAREALPSAAQAYAASAEWGADGGERAAWQDDAVLMGAGIPFPALEFYIPLIYPRPASVLDYLPTDGIVFVDDWGEMQTAVADLINHADQIGNEQESLPPLYPNPIFTWRQFSEALSWLQPIILGSGGGEGEAVSLLADQFESGPRYGGQIRPLMTQLKSAQRDGDRIIVASRQSARLAQLWRESGGGKPATLLGDLPSDSTLTFLQGSLGEGFTLVRRHDNQILLDLLTDAEIFGWKRPEPRRRRRIIAAAPETYFADINAGDYVVHLDYGIGRFEGLVSRNLGGMEREYLLVRYDNKDTLYVPAHHADRLSKWIGSSDISPKMHRIHGQTWGKTRAQAQRAADELAEDLLNLYADRETIAGHAFAPDGEWQAEMEASFPYRETEDQLRAIKEVKGDMERPLPMDRLVCGDVGYGKTEVALRAAFKAVMDGKQVAILVPTTILAQQHYQTFSMRLSPFPVKVEMLSRFRTHTQQERIVDALRAGQVDIIIGTHRLLSDDVSFRDLGMLIIDEEQRFGVAHKEKFKQWRTEVDVLTLTATPIPRTLHMSLTGVRNISIIDTAPSERLPVQTYVGEFDETRLRRALLRELDRGGQLFFVHNRVQSIHIVAKRLRELVPEAVVAVGHGQMGERALEKIMTDFEERKIDILLSTTIIESGIDFPNANTLIVDRAEMFGLAQLYQLRGRVGRGVRRAYAYFFHERWRGLSDVAQLRLETLAENTQLGAGYSIAMRDMEIRGVGDLLGASQSGHISAVGFDLYTRLLTTAVKRSKAARKGEVIKGDGMETAVLIDLPLPAYIPPDYVPEASLRLRLYRRMATLDGMEEIEGVEAELTDRFGKMPDSVYNLLYQLRVKILAGRGGVTAVTAENNQIKIRYPNLGQLDRIALQRHLGRNSRVSREAIWLSQEMGTREWKIALVQLFERLEEW